MEGGERCSSWGIKEIVEESSLARKRGETKGFAGSGGKERGAEGEMGPD
jgi:hypothetical protein